MNPATIATRLGAQKAIFNNQSRLLLLAAGKQDFKGSVILDNILRDKMHYSRHNAALNNRKEALLGSSLRTCVNTLRLVQQALDSITVETRGFEKPSSEKVSKDDSTRQSPDSRTTSRMKLPISRTSDPR